MMPWGPWTGHLLEGTITYDWLIFQFIEDTLFCMKCLGCWGLTITNSYDKNRSWGKQPSTVMLLISMAITRNWISRSWEGESCGETWIDGGREVLEVFSVSRTPTLESWGECLPLDITWLFYCSSPQRRTSLTPSQPPTGDDKHIPREGLLIWHPSRQRINYILLQRTA